MRTRFSRILVSLALVLAFAGTARASTTRVALKTSKDYESGPTASVVGSDTYFAWFEETRKNPDQWSVFVDKNGEGHARVNPKGTWGFTGQFDRGTPDLPWQKITSTDSNLFLYDASTGTSTALKALNTSAWEWNVMADSSSGPYYLFGRGWRVMLYQQDTKQLLKLDSAKARCECTYPQGLAYPYAGWLKRNSAYIYDISASQTSKVTLPSGELRSMSLTADGTVYVGMSDSSRCRSASHFYRIPLGGSAVDVYDVPAGHAARGVDAVPDGSGVSLYFSLYSCRSGDANIYRIDGADTATAVGVPSFISGGSSAPSDDLRAPA